MNNYQKNSHESPQPLQPSINTAAKSAPVCARPLSYGQQQTVRFYRYLILPAHSVLVIGKKLAWVTPYLQATKIITVDTTPTLETPVDYIIVAASILQENDPQTVLATLEHACTPKTRIIIEQSLTQRTLAHVAKLADYDVVMHYYRAPISWYIPGVSWALNTLIPLIPGLRSLCCKQVSVLRALFRAPKPTVSIIIPCKNERGTIETAVQECPELGSFTEIIFVEGNSHDGTMEEIKRVATVYPHKNISYYRQQAKGKGDAVRLGFEKAKGDIVIIQDSDLTVACSELPKFVDALVSGKGECVNGSRLMYTPSREAMPLINWLANIFFSRLLSWIIGYRLTDTLCGTKALWRSDYQKIAAHRAYFGTIDPFGDFDLLFGAAKLQLKILDIPVHYKARRYGSTQISHYYHGFILLGMSMIGLKKIKLNR